MKNIIIISFLVLLFVSCIFSITNTNQVEIKEDLSISKGLLYVKDSTLYSPSFIREQYLQYKTIMIKDEKMYYEGSIFYFPYFEEFNKSVILEASSDSCNYQLKFKFKNYTELDYELAVRGNKNLQRKGRAHINPTFYKSFEVDDDSDTKISYLCYQFDDKNSNEIISLRLGEARDDNGFLRANIVIQEYINDKLTTIFQTPITLRG